MAVAARAAFGEAAAEEGLAAEGVVAGDRPGAAAVFAALAFRELYPNVFLRNAIGGLLRLQRAAAREARETPLYGGFAEALANEIEAVADLLVARMERQYYDMKGSVVETLLKVVRHQDEYTQAHTMRVGALAGILHEGLYGTSPSEEFRLSVQLHDLGKVGVPQHIIQAPRRLTDEEAALMRKHPAIGSDLLSEMEADGIMIDAALHHHERWDGRGYPMGLVGEDIPAAARLIGVADAFDAMTSGRPYRPAGLSIDQAIAEIEAGAGSQFDPVMAEAFVRLPRESIERAVNARLLEPWHTI